MSAIPEPRPSMPYDKELGEPWGGMWKRELGSGLTQLTVISRLSSSSDPRLFDPTEERYRTPHCVIPSPYHGFEWYEGSRVTRSNEVETFRRDLTAEEMEPHVLRAEWSRLFLTYHEDGSHQGPVLDAFLLATNWAKTHYTEISKDGRFVYITYSSKLHRSRCLRVSAAVSRAFHVAHEHGIDARIIR